MEEAETKEERLENLLGWSFGWSFVGSNQWASLKGM